MLGHERQTGSTHRHSNKRRSCLDDARLVDYRGEVDDKDARGQQATAIRRAALTAAADNMTLEAVCVVAAATAAAGWMEAAGRCGGR